MTTTYTWTIAELERNASDNGVVIAHYRIDATDGEYTSGAYGSQGFTPDPASEDFIAFEDLTEEVVIGWVKESLGGDEKIAEIEAALQAKIDEQRNPPVVVGKPW